MNAALLSLKATYVLAAIIIPAVSGNLADRSITPTLLSHYRCALKTYGEGYCFRVAVPENRRLHAARMVSIYVVYLPAVTDRPVDAIAVIAGGPGEGSASDMDGVFTAAQVQRLRRHHALVFFDGRGTGMSSNIDCPIRWQTPQQYFSALIPFVNEDELRKCRARLAEKADLNQYKTVDAVQDLDDIRADLKIERLTLFGFSAGTTFAQVYARRYPSRVRALVMAGVASVGAHYPAPASRAKQVALTEVLEECEHQVPCRNRFPSIHADYQSAFQRAKRGVHTYVNGSRVDITYGIVADRLGFMLYGAQTAAQIPYFLHEGARNDWEALATTAYEFLVSLYSPPARGEASDISKGVYLSSLCAEDVPLIDAADIASTAGTFVGATRIYGYQRACSIWNVKAATPEPLTPISAPTLVISNRFDPATPRWIAKELIRQWPRAHQIVDASIGHLDDTSCIVNMSISFIETLDFEKIDDSCATHVQPLHFRLQ